MRNLNFRFFSILPVFLFALILVGCGPETKPANNAVVRPDNNAANNAANNATAEKPTAALHGTWKSENPKKLGLQGDSYHSFHPDGTIFTNMNTIDEKDGCHTSWRMLGKVDGTAEKLTINFNSGTKRIFNCTDAAKNVAETAFSQEELDKVKLDGAAWSVKDGVLKIGDEGIFNKVNNAANNAAAEKPTAALHGTWKSENPKKLGLQGDTYHSFHPDGTIFANVNIIDEKDGCHTSWRKLGKVDGTADKLSISFQSGTKRVFNCKDAAKNVAETAFSQEEMDKVKLDGAAWSVKDGVLKIGDEGIFNKVSS